MKSAKIKKNGTPYKKAIKPTMDEQEKRLDEMITFLSERPSITKTQIHQRFCTKWNLHWHTVDRYVYRAREEMVKRLKRSPEEFRSNALAFLEKVIGNPNDKTTDRLKAQEQLCDLLGIKAPTKLAMTDPEGNPMLQPDVKVFINNLTVSELRNMVQELKANTVELPPHSGNGHTDNKV